MLDLVTFAEPPPARKVAGWQVLGTQLWAYFRGPLSCLLADQLGREGGALGAVCAFQVMNQSFPSDVRKY